MRHDARTCSAKPTASRATVALRHFSMANVRYGSIASHRAVRHAPGMSAMPPIANQSVRRNEVTLCANSCPSESQDRGRQPSGMTRLSEPAAVEDGAFGDMAPIYDQREGLLIARVDFLGKVVAGTG